MDSLNSSPNELIIMTLEELTVRTRHRIMTEFPSVNRAWDMLLTLDQQHLVRTYHNSDINSFVVLTSGVNYNFLALLATIFPVIFRDKLLEHLNFKELLSQLAACYFAHDIKHFAEHIIKFAKENIMVGFEKEMLEKSFQDLRQLMIGETKEQIEKSLKEVKDTYQDQIERLQIQHDLIKQYEDRLILYNAGMTQNEDKFQRFVKFLIGSSKLLTYKMVNGQHVFSVIAEAWGSKDTLKHLLNANSNNGIRNSKYANVFESIFIKEEAKMMLYGDIYLDKRNLTNTHNITCHGGLKEGRMNVRTVDFGLPNPHIHLAGCLGNNKLEIIKALHREDYPYMFLQMVNTVGNINFADTGIMQSFFNGLTSINYMNKKCILFNDEKYTLEEYYNILKGAQHEVLQNDTGVAATNYQTITTGTVGGPITFHQTTAANNTPLWVDTAVHRTDT
jgi:hypothetical protein